MDVVIIWLFSAPLFKRWGALDTLLCLNRTATVLGPLNWSPRLLPQARDLSMASGMIKRRRRGLSPVVMRHESSAKPHTFICPFEKVCNRLRKTRFHARSERTPFGVLQVRSLLTFTPSWFILTSLYDKKERYHFIIISGRFLFLMPLITASIDTLTKVPCISQKMARANLFWIIAN